jgi:integrase
MPSRRNEPGRLTAVAVTQARAAGFYGDGGGLYLQVGPDGGKSWIFRFTSPVTGKRREMGLGPFHTCSLKAAREKARECRALVGSAIDPHAKRETERAAARVAMATAPTFDHCAAEYIRAHRSGWRNEKHADQWTSTLNTYASPVLGHLPVDSIDTTRILLAIQPIWNTKTETANRVRNRIELVLDWAKARGYRNGENPARWRGHLDKLLARRSKIRKVEHFRALPYSQIGSFLLKLRARTDVSARALEFLILTASRTNEVIGARWSEIDFSTDTWRIPAERMKANREHRVPLSNTAKRLLRALPRDTSKNGYVFLGARPGKPLSNMSLIALMRRIGQTEVPHGFRSTFRDWAAEVSTIPREIAEAALAHVLKDQTEAAYQRGDFFAKRQKLMQSWADYCDKLPSSRKAGK